MPHPINADYIFEVPFVSQPHLSDDGSTLAFVETTIDRATMERKARIIVSRRPFDDRAALTDGPTDTAPAIDNDRVFFLRPDDDDKKQVWAIPFNGGEARRVTDLPGGVEEFSLSPNGDRIAAVSPSTPTRRMSKSPACPACASSAASATAMNSVDTLATSFGNCS